MLDSEVLNAKSILLGTVFIKSTSKRYTDIVSKVIYAVFTVEASRS